MNKIKAHLTCLFGKTFQRVSQGSGEQGNMANFSWGTGGTKTKYLREQRNKKTFREHGNKALLNLIEDKTEKLDVRGTCLATFSPVSSIFVFQSVCMEM